MTRPNLGAYAALIAAGEDPRSLEKLATTASQDSTYNHTVYRPVLKAAAEVFERLGDNDTIATAYRMAVQDTEKAAAWGPVHDELVMCFTDALRATEKTAASLMEAAVQYPMAGVAATGASLGSLYWLLNRESSQDDADAERVRALRDYYRDLASDTKKRVARKLAPVVARGDKAFDDTHKTLDRI